MLYPSADKLNDFESRNMLVLLAAKRAKQLKEGAQPLVTTDSNHPLTVALEEIAQGKVRAILQAPDAPSDDVMVEVLPDLPLMEELPTEALASMSVVELDEATGDFVPADPLPSISALLEEPTAEQQIDMDDEQLQDEIIGQQGTELFGAPSKKNRLDVTELLQGSRDDNMANFQDEQNRINNEELGEDENTDAGEE